MKTQQEIENLISKMDKWNLLTGLTKREIESIKQDLKRIAGTAVMEAHNKIQNILPKFYEEITK